MDEPSTPSEFRFQPPEVRRRQILDAAGALAVEHGFDNVSIDQVAEKAGLAKGSVYRHYDSRQALAAALQADLWDRMLDEPQAIVERDDLTAGEKLDQVIAALVRYEAENQELHHELFHLTGDSQDVDDDPWQASRQLLAELLEEGSDSGEFDMPDVPLTADFILHAYSGPTHGNHNVAVEQAIEIVQELIRRVVRA